MLDGDLAVRQETVSAIGDIVSPDSVSQLVKLNHDPDKVVRANVAESLGKIGTEDCIVP